MRAWDCMKGDLFWVVATVALNIFVVVGYIIIAHRWKQAAANSPPSVEKKALNELKFIFMFCALCGYMFIPIKMVWPAWRLYDFVLVVLIYYTFRFVFRGGKIKLVYDKLNRVEALEHEVEERRSESRRKSAFLSALSHDIRTPLNGVSMTAQLANMQLKAGDNQGAVESLRDIGLQVQAATELLNSFLEMGRMDLTDQGIENTEINLDEFVESLKKDFDNVAKGKGLRLTVSCKADTVIYSDKTKLRRVIYNLVDNALKFTDSGHVSLTVDCRNDILHIEVSDSGRGMNTDDFENLFNEFYQGNNPARDRTKGFGLGLAIVRRVVAALNGKISVESRVGIGSRFTVTIPTVVVSSEGGEYVEREGSLSSGGRSCGK